jgi:ATP-binding cassette, subfamily B, bacterial
LKPASDYRQLLPYMQPHWRIFAIALVCTVAFVTTMPLMAYMVGQAGGMIGEGQVAALAQLSGLVAVLFIVRGILLYGQDSLMAKAAFAIVLDLRQRVYRHLHSLGLDYFETAATGDLSYRLTEDIDRIGEVINKAFHQLVPCILTILSLLGYMLYLNWPLTLATLITAPLVGVLVGWFGDRLLQLSRLSQNQVANLSSMLTEVFSGIRLVKAFAAEPYEINRFVKAAQTNQQSRYATERVKAIQYPVIAFLEAVSIIMLFLLGTWQISLGNLTAKDLISFGTGVALIIEPIQQITANYSEIKQGQASLDRVFELFQIQPNIKEKPGAIALATVNGQVEYRQIQFGYRLDQPVLQNLNLLALPGEVIALVGHSGAGKTTLVNLLPRFYDPQSGQILVDGVDIQTVTVRSLRQQIGLVPQETVLFSGTIAENIAFGQTELDMSAIQAAAKVANAHQFISQFPEGYQTWVGERGITLSGGQRQRIAIARAVLRNPRILILDEATSALDAESEALVQEALERVMQGRTVFIIAHRLTTVRRADRIVVLEQGRVVESGTHAELLNQTGGSSRYARFYARQLPD